MPPAAIFTTSSPPTPSASTTPGSTASISRSCPEERRSSSSTTWPGWRTRSPESEADAQSRRRLELGISDVRPEAADDLLRIKAESEHTAELPCHSGRKLRINRANRAAVEPGPSAPLVSVKRVIHVAKARADVRFQAAAIEEVVGRGDVNRIKAIGEKRVRGLRRRGERPHVSAEALAAHRQLAG